MDKRLGKGLGALITEKPDTSEKINKLQIETIKPIKVKVCKGTREKPVIKSKLSLIRS